MALFKCLIPVERTNYSGTPGIEVVQSQLDGGLPRIRKDQLGASEQVTVQWSVGRADYDYLRAFYRTGINYGASPFLIDLIIDGPNVTEYTATLEPGTFTLASQTGVTYVVQATLNVQPLPVDVNDDLILLARNS